MAELLLALALIEWSLLKFFYKKWASLLKYGSNYSSVKFYGTGPRSEKPLKITKSVFLAAVLKIGDYFELGLFAIDVVHVKF